MIEKIRSRLHAADVRDLGVVKGITRRDQGKHVAVLEELMVGVVVQRFLFRGQNFYYMVIFNANAQKLLKKYVNYSEEAISGQTYDNMFEINSRNYFESS